MGGLLLGGIRIRKIGLGSAGVMFVGILAGHWGATLDHDVAEFAKEFGLVLFVFTIGLQLGPGIVQLWKEQGLVLNAMAVGVVVMGVLLILMFHALIDLPALAAGGLFSGATTNTPSLGAAQQAAAAASEAAVAAATAAGGEAASGEASSDFGMLAAAYAVAYPGGILGIIATILILKAVFKIDIEAEAEAAASYSGHRHQPIVRRCVEVDNKHLADCKFGDIPGVEETGVRIARIKRRDQLAVDPATDQTVLVPGDIIQVVGTESGLKRFVPLIGHVTEFDLTQFTSNATVRRIVVTAPRVVNMTLQELSLDLIYNSTITRIIRSGVEVPGRGSSRLQYGDILHAVGDEESLDRVAELLGNSAKELNETQFAPVFLGIFVGVVVGMIPLSIPGVPFPVKLGLAGGPLIAAIVFSLLGKVGKFVWHIPFSANLALRELGIIMFLASAGLSAGKTFFAVALTSQGLLWMLAGLVVTMVPLLVVGVIGRLVFKVNYLTLCGVLSGSMTDPPALAFANSLSDSAASATGYAAVYPLTMVMRIIAAQAIIYMLFA